jgi:hypothetical protein
MTLDISQQHRINLEYLKVAKNIQEFVRNTNIIFKHHNRLNSINTVLFLSINYGPGSSVGIVTDYLLDGPGIESRWGRDFSPAQTGPGAHPASCTRSTESFPGVKCGRSVLLTNHPLLVPRSWKSRAIPVPPSAPQPGL